MKSKSVINIILSIIVLLATGFLQTKPASAAVTYLSPHNPWLKLAAVTYVPTMTDAEAEWAAQTFDMFDNPHDWDPNNDYDHLVMQKLRPLTDAKMLRYIEFASVNKDDDWVPSVMQSYLSQCGGKNMEDYFIHSGGSRITFKDFGWYTNPGSSVYRCYMKKFATNELLENGYDGLFIDDGEDGVLAHDGADGSSDEYSSSTAYDNALHGLYDEVRSVYQPLGKIIVPNDAEYYSPNSYSHTDGIWHEFVFHMDTIDDKWGERANRFADVRAGGAFNVVGFKGITDDGSKIKSLAAFYMIADNSKDYYARTESNDGPLQTDAWFPALSSKNGDIGTPIDPVQDGTGSLMRKYTKGVALLNFASQHTYTLPSGTYRPLNADGSLGSPVTGTYTVPGWQGAILINSNPASPSPTGVLPTITKAVDKASASSGATLTYTISYSYTGVTTLTNAKVEDPIPSGTTYVTGSTTGGATYDSTNNKIVLTIGNLAAGASGTLTFKVKVN